MRQCKRTTNLENFSWHLPARALLVLVIVSLSSLSLYTASLQASQADIAGDGAESSFASENQGPCDKDDVAGAFGGALDGRLLYEKACASCHANGFNGAPRLVPSDWPNYEQVGVEPYTVMAIQGVGIMPPRGGQPDLTDEQVRRAVEYILDQLDGS